MLPWQRNLWAIVVAEVMALLSFQASFILIPYYIQQLGITDLAEVAAWTSAFQSIGAIGFTIATPIWGALGDRYGRKPMLVRAMIATSLVLVGLGLIRTPVQLMVLRAIQGFFTGTPAAATALVATGSPKHRLAYALGLVQTSVFVGNTLGPMVGGFIADSYGYRATFFTGGVIVLLATVAGLQPGARVLGTSNSLPETEVAGAVKGKWTHRALESYGLQARDGARCGRHLNHPGEC